MRPALRDRKRKRSRSRSPDSDTPSRPAASSKRRGSYFFPRDSDEESKSKSQSPEETLMPLPDPEERKAYEEMRKRNIAEKNELLKLFGFSPRPLNVAPAPQPTPRTKRVLKNNPIPKLRLTLRSRTRDGRVAPPKVEQDAEKSESEEEEEEEEQGDMMMIPVQEEDDEKKYGEYIRNLLPHLAPCKKEGGKVVDLDSFKRELKGLCLQESSIAKVGIKRTFSMALHPSESKILVVTGDAMGNIGMWDVKGGTSPQVYQPHKSPVFCTSFCPVYPTRLYTTSIDGIVRRCDLNKLLFEKIYSSKGRMTKNHTTWHCQKSESEMAIAHGDGSVGFLDMRAGEDSVQFFKCHDRSTRTVHIHPAQDQFFVTASGVGEVCIWDARMINKKLPKPICSMTHSKGLKSAFFSPAGSLLLTTCNDDRLRIFNTMDVQATKSHVVTTVVHNNQTGRWLTPFKAMWHPRRDDVFVIGSMDPDRAVDVYGVHGLPLRKLRDPLLTTILPVVRFHPTLDVVVGANSSGRVHVFMAPQ